MRERNWNEIQECLDQGLTILEITKRLPVSKQTITNAFKKGLLQRPSHHKVYNFRRYTIEEYCNLWMGRPGRGHFLRHLKEKAFEQGLWERKCYTCELHEWMGQPIPLEINHKDGDNTNNRFENLEPNCRNCHFLTETWGNPNKRGPVV